MVTIHLGIGGNIGDTEAEIARAFEFLQLYLHNPQISGMYRTLPRDDIDQAPFINAVIKGETEKSPEQLLDLLQHAEKVSGRVRDPLRPKGPRSLDIDMLLFGRSVIETSRLTVPHPRMNLRKFVLVPLLELTPDLSDPATGKYYASMLQNLPDQGIYFLTMNEYSGSLSWGDIR